jgi:hypothetical protein
MENLKQLTGGEDAFDIVENMNSLWQALDKWVARQLYFFTDSAPPRFRFRRASWAARREDGAFVRAWSLPPLDRLTNCGSVSILRTEQQTVQTTDGGCK